MTNIKLILKILFIVFLATNGYDNAAALWQKATLIVVATVLMLFVVSDYVTEKKRGNSSVG